MSFSPDAFRVDVFRGLDGEELAISLKKGRAVPCSRSVDVIRRQVARVLGVAPCHFRKLRIEPGATFLELRLSVAAHLRAQAGTVKQKTEAVLRKIAGRLQAVHRPRHPRHNKESYRPANRRHVMRAAGVFR